MAVYHLRRISDQRLFDCDATNEKHAVALFSEQLGVNLTIEEGLAAPQYMMARVPSGPHWAEPEYIPVYETQE